MREITSRSKKRLQSEVLDSKYQDTVDHSIEEWVEAVLVRGLNFNGRTVSDFFEEYEAYAAEWGRRLTTANFNPNKSGFYTSYDMTERNMTRKEVKGHERT